MLQLGVGAGGSSSCPGVSLHRVPVSKTKLFLRASGGGLPQNCTEGKAVSSLQLHFSKLRKTLVCLGILAQDADERALSPLWRAEARAQMGFSKSPAPLRRVRLVTLKPGRAPGQVAFWAQNRGPFSCLAGSLAAVSRPSILIALLARPTHCLNSVRWERGGRALAFPVLVHSCPDPLRQLRAGRGMSSHFLWGLGGLSARLLALASISLIVSLSEQVAPLRSSGCQQKGVTSSGHWQFLLMFTLNMRVSHFHSNQQITTGKVLPFRLFVGSVTTK